MNNDLCLEDLGETRETEWQRDIQSGIRIVILEDLSEIWSEDYESWRGINKQSGEASPTSRD